MSYLTLKQLDAMSSEDHRQYIRVKLANRDGRDGLALDIVLAIAELDGEQFNDGECLELIGDLIDVWRVWRDING